MDPALGFLINEGHPDDEVAVLIRLIEPISALPDWVRVVTTLGDIASVRVTRGVLETLRGLNPVLSVKAPTHLSADVEYRDGPHRTATTGEVAAQQRERRPTGVTATGRGVVVGMVDWGLDFTHPAFRNPDGSTRLLALWDQQPGPESAYANRYGYGRIFSRSDIDAALRATDPFSALNYQPWLADGGFGTHGSATTSIAAGSAWPGGVSGLAPEADIVFVHASTWGAEGRQGLGDSVALAEALDFIRGIAVARPCVINLSLGAHGGPHDGSTLLEQAMDAIVVEHPGRMIVQSCGNYFGTDTHAQGQLFAGQEACLGVEIPAGTTQSHKIEVWYAGVDRMSIGVIGPGGRPSITALPGEHRAATMGDTVGEIRHRLSDPNDGRNHAVIQLNPTVPAGVWQVVLRPIDVVDGRYHAWIEREPARWGPHLRFSPDAAVTSTTTGTISNGYRPLSVGAYDARSADRPVAPFSSCGPTVDGRRKPDLLAPGCAVIVARSRPADIKIGEDEPPQISVMSGTSMAAPHVTGAVACLLQDRMLSGADIRTAILTQCEPYTGDEPGRAGSGYLRLVGTGSAAEPTLVTESVYDQREWPNELSATLKGRTDEEYDESVAADFMSTRFAGDGVLSAVSAGTVRLAKPGTAPYPSPVTSSGAAVQKVQQALIDLGYPMPTYGADGRYGDETGRAVSKYKSDRSITPSDPVIGPLTITSLDRDISARDAPNPLPPAPAPPPVPPPPVDPVQRWTAAMGPAMLAGNTADSLVDGPESLTAMKAAVDTAVSTGHFIYLLGWWLDIDVPLDAAVDPRYCLAGPPNRAETSSLRNVLKRAADNGVQIRVMLWNNPIPFQDPNSAAIDYINSMRAAAAIHDPGSNKLQSHHQKVLLVNGTQGLIAFCGGIDINRDRICPGTAATASPGSGPATGDGDPLHDVHCRITGPAADRLLQTFVRRWYANPLHHNLDKAKGPLLALCQRPSPPTGPAAIRVGETFNATVSLPALPVANCLSPPAELPAQDFHDRDVQEIYLTAIANARTHIYWEDQYLVSMCAAEALRRALSHVEFIILVTADGRISDLPHRWERRKMFVEHIRNDPLGAKLHVFTLSTPNGGIGPHTYVHAKSMMIDDEVALVGSANCNRRGWESDTEVVAAIAGTDSTGTPFAKRLRQRLWTEHLGVAPGVVADAPGSAPLWWLPPGPSGAVTLPSGVTVALPARRVQPYDVNGGTDSPIWPPVSWDQTDPPWPTLGAPCGGLSATATPITAALQLSPVTAAPQI